MRGEPHPTLIEKMIRAIALLLGREPKPAKAYAYARVRRDATIDPRREPRF